SEKRTTEAQRHREDRRRAGEGLQAPGPGLGAADLHNSLLLSSLCLCASVVSPIVTWPPPAGGARTAGCRRAGSTAPPAACRCAPGPGTSAPRRGGGPAP